MCNPVLSGSYWNILDYFSGIMFVIRLYLCIIYRNAFLSSHLRTIVPYAIMTCDVTPCRYSANRVQYPYFHGDVPRAILVRMREKA